MSSKKSATTLHIELQPSKLAAIVLLSMHAGAVVVVSTLAVTSIVKLVLILLVISSALVSLNKAGWLVFAERWPMLFGFCQRVEKLVWDDSHDWYIYTRNAGITEAQLLGSSYYHLRLVVLNFKLKKSRGILRYRSVVIPFDAVDEETFRQVRVRLGVRPFAQVEN